MNMGNVAFIDGQNLHLAVRDDDWALDYKKFRVFLKERYKVESAYYYMGYIMEDNKYLYDNLQKAGFIVRFREHRSNYASTKKGNVDAKIIFDILTEFIDKSSDFGKIILVSGDGDYKPTVEYLIAKNRFEKILFPSKKNCSSLYKKISRTFYDFLSNHRTKIQYKKKGGPNALTRFGTPFV